MDRLNVRRLAAVDMWGATGSTLRRRLILAEFLVGVVGSVGVAIWLLATTSSPGWLAFGAWLLGVGLNYAPLAAFAVWLTPDQRLERELAGVDVAEQLRYYSIVQFWVFVPLALVVLAVRQRADLMALSKR